MQQRLDLPARAPVRLALKHAQPADSASNQAGGNTNRTVTGRVLDTRHRPLAGVQVTFNAVGPIPGEINKASAVTDADGYYHLVNIPTGSWVDLNAVEKTGYRLSIGSNVQQCFQNTVNDLEMTACNGAAHGGVYDAAGKPIAGALVASAEGGWDNRSVSDAQGRFTLTNQPEGELHLVAATPGGGGIVDVNKKDQDVRIICTPGTPARLNDIPLAMQLLDADSKLPVDQRRFDYSASLNLLSVLDLAQAVHLSLRGDVPVTDGLRAYLLGKQAERDPAKVDEIIVQLNVLKDPLCKLYAEVEVGSAVAATNPELAEKLYQSAGRPLTTG